MFLTQESSTYILEEALRLGADGYVLEAYATNELLLVVDAAFLGEASFQQRM